MMKHNYLYIAAVTALLLVPQGIFAAGISLSVTPTLFEMSAIPNQSWNSSVKVINSNPHDITVYAQVVNFAPQGEIGHGKFLPVFENFTEGKTLAEWITVSDEAFTISEESSMSIPLTVHVPEDASPGGHYAAVMVGTRPPKKNKSLQVATSQIVTSLFFVRVSGDVIENGVVRTFRVEDSFVGIPEVNFEVRFENKGNVHLQPQGEIVITNMWGKERGIVPINHQTHFGNVLPKSVRKFNFAWKGEQSFTDIGRYKASLTLAYGQDSRKFATQASYFWVIPIKAVTLVLGSFFAILFLVSWSIRAYVRKMLEMSGVQGYVPASKRLVREGDVLIERRPSVRAPISRGVSDLKTRLERTHAFIDTLYTLFDFVRNYKKFFGSLLLLVIAFIAIWYYFVDVTTPQRDYEVVIDNLDTPVTLSSEEIIYDQTETDSSSAASLEVSEEATAQEFELILINSSDTPGAAAQLQKELESEGYSIESLKSDFEESKTRTVVVYDVENQETALELSKFLGGALLSARPATTSTTAANISVYIGNDYTGE